MVSNTKPLLPGLSVLYIDACRWPWNTSRIQSCSFCLWCVVCMYVCIYLAAPWHMESPCQGSDLSCACDPGCGCGKHQIPNPLCRVGDWTWSQHSQDATDPVVLQREFLPVVLGRGDCAMDFLVVWWNLWIPSQNVSEYDKWNMRDQRRNQVCLKLLKCENNINSVWLFC